MPKRHLELEGCSNLRDLGGYPTRGGGQTRWNTIYRSDSLHALAPAGQQELLARGLRTVIDLRWAEEAIWEPNVLRLHPQVRYRALPFYGAFSPYDIDLPRHLGLVYQRDLEHQQPQIKGILEALLEPEATPALIHCAVGKDRTGLICALLLGLAEVPAEIIVADYALSGVYLASYFDQLRQEVTPEALAAYGYSLECHPSFMETTLAYLEATYAGVAGYLRSIGLSDRQCAGLRDLLVVEEP